MATIREVFGANMKRLRKARGLTQQGLADRTGLSMATIQHLELGNRWAGVETIEVIAKELDAPETAFFMEALPATVESLTKIIEQQETRIRELEAGFSLPPDIVEMLAKAKEPVLAGVRALLVGEGLSAGKSKRDAGKI